MNVQLVWFKRDLRVADHRPLFEAARHGPCLCLYVYEPEVLRQDEYDPAHLRFANESLAELDRRLQERGGRLVHRVGRVPDVLEALHAVCPIARVWSHEECGNRVARTRDARARAWARERGVAWVEVPQDGIVRGSADGANGESRTDQWRRRMQEPVVPAPDRITAAAVDPEGARNAADLGLAEPAKDAQPGGQSRGEAVLQAFLVARGAPDLDGPSSPPGADACSRLGPHLSFGNLSLRQVVQATRAARGRADDPAWHASLDAFAGRLRARAELMQAFEDDPGLEFRSRAADGDGLRAERLPRGRFLAWCEGRTGYPLVDAGMRALVATGWTSFRMRALLVSFASSHLRLPWRPAAVFLARHLLDFEPGVHFPQVQMLAGATGAGALRVDSPAQLAREHDPRGAFVRRWVPELESVPDEHVAEPHRMPRTMQQGAGCIVGRDYPEPVVDHGKAVAEAQRRIAAARRSARARTGAATDAARSKAS